jgi:predicted permease
MHALRSAIRSLAASPAPALTIILTLALGTGANTAIFSIVNSLLLRTLPVPEPGRLVTISSDFALAHGFKSGVGWNYAMWTRLQQLPPLFDGVLLWSQPTFNLAAAGERDPARALLVSGSFFETLGLVPRAGRLLTPQDDVRGGGSDGPVTVLSYRFWRDRFYGRFDAIGKTLTFDGVPFTIVGVTEPGFLGLEVGQAFDVAIPLATEPLILGARASIDEPRAFIFTPLVRLKPDQPLSAATAVLRSIQPHVLGVSPDRVASVSPQFLREPFVAVPAPTGTSDFTRLRTQYQRPLLTLTVLVGLVLVIACVNVAGMLLARATGRRHEVAVRLALGAQRQRLVAQHMLESVVLATVGAALGLLISRWTSPLLVAQLSRLDTRVSLDLTPDWHVLAFTVSTALVTAMIFGLAPALRATNVAPVFALRGPAGSLPDSGRGSHVASAFLIVQVALSLTLTVAAGLLVATFGRLLNVPLGFDSKGVLVATIDTSAAAVAPGDRIQFIERVLDAVRNAPGVAAAAASSDTPLSKASQSPVMLKAERVQYAVTPGWFDTYRTDLLSGRGFTPADDSSAPPVAIINEAYARKFFPDRNALGLIVEKATVVGIARNAVSSTIRGGARPTIYRPLAQVGNDGPARRAEVFVSVRSTSAPPALLTREVSAALTSVDPRLVFSYTPLQDFVDASLAEDRMLARIAGLFGVLSVALTALGLYGVTSYAVSRRQFEIGVRMALGATRIRVLGLILSRSLVLTLAGVCIGLAGCIATTRYLQAALFGIAPMDPTTITAVVALLIVSAAVAALVPALRATRIDPLVALRAE